MSRVAKRPIALPKGVEVKLDGRELNVKGPKGTVDFKVHPAINVAQQDGHLQVSEAEDAAGTTAMAGTTRALLANIVKGVTSGFERKLELVGVGYRAQAQGKVLNLTLGFSHPVKYPVPEGITIETPSQTEVVVRGVDKQQVGQVAAEIRGFRPPEPYKGKGVRYANERVVRKEAKKK
ncbi:MAG TPA: 50S ribosomal protein L6 [Gammaproteobacteria bacterium]|nr:50S ribosomal protein L6 [Gammaproteobacteria bacterium]